MAEELAKALNIDMSGPKTYENLFKKQKEIGDEITKVEMGVADLTSSRDLSAAKARQETISKAQEKYETESGDIQKKMDSFGEVKFQPTQDNIQDIAGLFSAVGIIGAMIGGSGRNSAMNALSSMTGMLDGWKKGRGDLFRQEKIKFDSELNRIKLEKDTLIQKLNMIEKEYSRNKEKAEQDFQVVLAEYNSPILKQMAALGGLKRTSEYANNTLGKSVDKAVELSNQMTMEGVRQQNRVALKNMGTSSISGISPKSAINERFQNTVLRSSNEVLRNLELIQQIGIGTGKGVLGGVVGKGDITSEIMSNVGQKFTEEQQRNYNTAMSALALELAYAIGGGYKPNEATITELRNALTVGPNDTIGNAAYKFSDVIAKLKATLEVAPSYSQEQKQYKDDILKKLDKYAPPEVVYERMYGKKYKPEELVQRNPSPGKEVKRTGKVTSGINAGKTAIEYADGTMEYR